MFPPLFFQKVPEKILNTIKESVSESEGFYNRIKQYTGVRCRRYTILGIQSESKTETLL